MPAARILHAARAARAIPPLNEIVGMPLSASPAELDHASERYFQAMLDRASRGDAEAQCALVVFRVAYLNWAYASPDTQEFSGNSNTLSTITDIPGNSLSQVPIQRWT